MGRLSSFSLLLPESPGSTSRSFAKKSSCRNATARHTGTIAQGLPDTSSGDDSGAIFPALTALHKKVCERPPAAFGGSPPFSRGRMQSLTLLGLLSPLQRGTAAEGGRGSLTHSVSGLFVQSPKAGSFSRETLL